MDLNKRGKTARFIIVELLFVLISIIVYRFVMGGIYDNPIDAELKWAHKPMNEYVLSAENDTVSEEILLNIPNIRSVHLNGKALDVTPDASMDVKVTHVDSGSVLADCSVSVIEAFDADGESFKIKLVGNEYTGGKFAISIHLDNPGSTRVVLTANTKSGIVTSFNDNADDKTNVIYRVKYGNVKMISKLFFILVFLLMVFLGIICLGIETRKIWELFPALMIILARKLSKKTKKR